MIPFIGWGGTGTKWGRKIAHAADTGGHFAGGVGKVVREVSRQSIPFKKSWTATKLSPDLTYGCEKFAESVQKAIGGKIVEITPNRGRFLPNFKGVEPGWQNHVVVIKDGRVYDAFTGSKGMAIDEYKKLWDWVDYINFGF